MNISEQNKYSFKEKQQNRINRTDKKILDIYNKYEKIKRRYDIQLSVARKEQKEILRAQYIDLGESIEAIAYLVSLIEGKQYSSIIYPVLLHAPDAYLFYPLDGIHTCKGIKYNIVFLISNELREQALTEISERYYITENNWFNFEDVDKRLKEINKNIYDTSDNYVQLLYFKDTDGKYVYYNSDSIKYVFNSPREVLESDIREERYSYIYDYMDSVVCYRLDKTDLKVSLEEMLELARKFANEYKITSKVKQKKL